jgi:hypothetical protein
VAPEPEVARTSWTGVVAHDAPDPGQQITERHFTSPPEVFTGLFSLSPLLYWRWSGVDNLAAVDIDVVRDAEPGRRFTDAEIPGLLAQAAPLPKWGWVTRSGGVRLIFTAADGLTAGARAAAYLMLTDLALDDRIRRSPPGIEVLSNTRRPPEGNTVWESDRTSGVADLAGRLRSRGGEAAVTPEEVAAWLEGRGLSYGRWPHEQCPVEPGASSSHRDPVIIREDGVYCHRCAGLSGRGWIPWSRLVGAREAGEADPVAAMVLHWTHWAHARLVLQALYPGISDQVLRNGYSTLLRMVEPDEDRIGRVFWEDLDFVRSHSGWLRAGDLQPHDTISLRTIGLLPWTRGLPPRIDTAAGTGPLPGYPPIVPLWHVQDKVEWKADHVVVPRPVQRTPFHGDPHSWTECVALLCASLPGCTEMWCKALLAVVIGALRAQRGAATPPLTILHGPTGCGKGALVAAAQGVLASPDHNFKMSADVTEIERALGTALEAGAQLIVGNEVGKTAAGFWAKSAPLLDMSDMFTWRKLMAGWVNTPARAHLLLVGSTLPRGLVSMPEFNRRGAVFVLPRVDENRRWQEGCREAFGVDSLRRLRSTSEGTRLAESILAAARPYASRVPLPSWPEQAVELSASELADDEEAQALDETVRRLYRAWISNEENSTVSATDIIGRWEGWMRGWRAGSGKETAAIVLEGYFADTDSPDERTAKTGRLETADVVRVCRLARSVQLDLRVRWHGRKVALRFEPPGGSLQRTDRGLFPEPSA